MSLTPTKPRNPCPICEDTSGKCRQGRKDLSYWQCMTYAGVKKGEIVSGYKCIGTSKDGMWGQFKPDNSTEWTEQQHTDWKLENQRRQQQKAKVDDERRRRSLSAVERDKGYRQMLDELTLHPDDRADLVRRGFTAAQIELSGFRSIGRYQQLQGQYSELLPGINRSSRIVIREEGYLCPIRNTNGFIVACQVRLRTLPSTESNRYRWLSGDSQTLHLFPDGCKSDGELPLAVHLPEKLGKFAIGICEGTGAKPFLAAQKLGIPFIGAAGGQHAGSEVILKSTIQQIEETLWQAAQETGLNSTNIEIILTPDAGSLINKQVISRWEQVTTLLEDWGYEVKVAWWNQFSKGDRDIDELKDFSTIRYINPGEFFNLGQPSTTPQGFGSSDNTPNWKCRTQRVEPKEVLPRLGFKCYSKEDNHEEEENIQEIQRKLRVLSYPADIDISSRYLPDDLINQLPKSGLIGIKAPKGCGKSVILEKIITLAKEQGIPVLSITPRIALGREQAVKWEITWIDEYGHTRNSGINTASQIEGIIRKIEKLEAELVELNRPTQRNTFVDSVTEVELKKVDLLSEIELHTKEIENINISALNAIALCWDSIWKVKDRNYDNGLVIVDEAELGLNHLITGSTCRRSRPKLIKTFKDIVNDCLMMGGRVILSDADLSDLPVNYIRDLLPIPINPFIIKNEYIGKENTWIVDFRTGSRACTLDEIIRMLKEGLHLFITTDSKKEARALEKLVIKECEGFSRLFNDDNEVISDNKKSDALIIRLDSGSAESEVGKEIIRKPNKSILKWGPRLMIATPTLGVGVSIDESTVREVEGGLAPYFDAVVGLFFGVIEPSQCRQQLARVRANVPRLVFAVEGNHRIGGNASFFPDEINRQSIKYSHESLSALDMAKAIAGDDANDAEIISAMSKLYKDCWDEQGEVWNNPSIKLHSAFKARENYGLWNLSALLREELEDEGHRIVSIKGGKGDLIDAMSEIKEADRIAEAEARAAAPVIEHELALELMKKSGTTSEERRSVAKALLQEELPELELDAEFIDKATLKDNGRWLAAQKLFWRCMNQEATLDKDTDNWLKGFRRGVEGGLFAPDIKSYSPKVKALRESGLLDWVDLENPEKTYDGSSTEGKAFLSQSLKSRDLIKTALGISVNSNSSPLQVAKRMLGKVGLSLRKVTKSKKDGRHKIDLETANDPDRIRVLSSLDLKWVNQTNPVIARAEVGGVCQFVYNKNAELPPIIQEEKASEIGIDLGSSNVAISTSVLSETEQLAEALSFCDSIEVFKSVIEGESQEDIQDAIALAPSIPLRSKLRGFYEMIYGQLEYLWGNVVERVAKAAKEAREAQGDCGEGLGLAT